MNDTSLRAKSKWRPCCWVGTLDSISNTFQILYLGYDKFGGTASKIRNLDTAFGNSSNERVLYFGIGWYTLRVNLILEWANTAGFDADNIEKVSFGIFDTSAQHHQPGSKADSLTSISSTTRNARTGSCSSHIKTRKAGGITCDSIAGLPDASQPKGSNTASH